MQNGQVLDDRPFVDVLKGEQLSDRLQEVILYALACADAAQTPSSEHTGAQAQHDGSQAQSAASSASSADTSAQQEEREPPAGKSCSRSAVGSSARTALSQHHSAASSAGLMSHSEGMDTLAQYMRSAGR